MKEKTKQKSKKNIFKHFFIPHFHNQYRPYAFRHKMLTIYSLALFVAEIAVGVGFYSGPSYAQGSVSSMKQDIVQLTSQERVSNGLPSLNENSLLTEAASAKLADMFQNNYWDHLSPQGVEAWDFISQAHYQYIYAGENLARGFVDADATVQAWMASESHRKNILNPAYRDIGVAVGEGKINGKPTVLIVQLFGGQTKVAGVSSEVSASKNQTIGKTLFNQNNFVLNNRLPFFIMWLALFALIVFDGVMVRRNGHHRQKGHLFHFRTALIVNILVLVVLGLNYVSIT